MRERVLTEVADELLQRHPLGPGKKPCQCFRCRCLRDLLDSRARAKELEDKRDNLLDLALIRGERAEARVKKLEEAGLALYYAGFWTCDREVDETAMWERLRNGLDLPAGTSPKHALRGKECSLDVSDPIGGRNPPLERGEEKR